MTEYALNRNYALQIARDSLSNSGLHDNKLHILMTRITGQRFAEAARIDIHGDCHTQSVQGLASREDFLTC